LTCPAPSDTLLACIGVTLLALCAAATGAHAAAPMPAPDRPVRVATGRIAPFVIPEGERLTGFSIDLWKELARRLRVEFAWTDVGSMADQIQAVRDLRADSREMVRARELARVSSTSYNPKPLKDGADVSRR